MKGVINKTQFALKIHRDKIKAEKTNLVEKNMF